MKKGLTCEHCKYKDDGHFCRRFPPHRILLRDNTISANYPSVAPILLTGETGFLSACFEYKEKTTW